MAVASKIPATIWTVTVRPGDEVGAGDTVAIIESMKMEMPVTTAFAGRGREIRVRKGQTVGAGDIIATVETA